MKTSLGSKESEMGYAIPSTDTKTKERTIYPEFSVSGNPAKSLSGMEVGEEYTATVKLRVSGMTERQEGKYDSGCRVEFEVLEIDVPGMDAEDEGEEDAETAVDDWKSERDEEAKD